jgi:DNA (cytosine-5)-methyltransferase 1
MLRHNGANHSRLKTTMLTTANDQPALNYLHAAQTAWPALNLAQHFGVSLRTLQRWKGGEIVPPRYVVAELQRLLDFGASGTPRGDFRFIDLFAGIGGIRQAFESIGGECVFTSEWDSYAQKTYAENYPGGQPINGDITQIEAGDIPDHDVLLGGFPCQPFSIAGVSKKNALGRAHGFQDATQGTLFFDVARIIDKKCPKAFLLENVKNLQSHNKGRTFDVIKRTLEVELGYKIHCKVIDGAHFVPQHRERILIVGFRDPTIFDWETVSLPGKGSHVLGEILHRGKDEPFVESDGDKYFDHKAGHVLDKYTLTDKLWAYLQAYKRKHQAAGNGFGFGLVTPDSVTRTLSARYYKDGSEILVSQGSRKNPRRLTPRECARLMGFPDSFKIPVSDTRAYKQFGNSVVVPVMEAVAKAMQPLVVEPQYNEDVGLRRAA